MASLAAEVPVCEAGQTKPRYICWQPRIHLLGKTHICRNLDSICTHACLVRHTTWNWNIVYDVQAPQYVAHVTL